MQSKVNFDSVPVKVVRYFDALKKNNCPRIEMIDAFGRERKIFDPTVRRDYFVKSDETGLSVRYAAELSNGQLVSLDGALRICAPEIWANISAMRQSSNTMVKKLNSIKYLFSYMEISKMCEDVAQELFESGVTTETFRPEVVSKDLDSNGHILGGLLNASLSAKDKSKIVPSNLIWVFLQDMETEFFYSQNKERIDAMRKEIGVSAKGVLEKEPAAINSVVLAVYNGPDLEDLKRIPFQRLIDLIHLRIDEVVAFRKQNQMELCTK